MIFLTVGTQLPFDRLTAALDGWCAHSGTGGQVFGQVGALGPGNCRPQNFSWAERIGPDDFRARAEAAAVIVSHAGMGTIISALSLGKPLVLLARRAHLGEQRNDHQFATLARFAARPGIFAAESEAGLPAQIEAALAAARSGAGGQGPGAGGADPRLIAALRGFLSQG